MGSQKILLNPAEVNFGEIENGNIYSIQLQVQNVHKSSIKGLVKDFKKFSFKILLCKTTVIDLSESYRKSIIRNV